jgi:hypothetical protein
MAWRDSGLLDVQHADCGGVDAARDGGGNHSASVLWVRHDIEGGLGSTRLRLRVFATLQWTSSSSQLVHREPRLLRSQRTLRPRQYWHAIGALSRARRGAAAGLRGNVAGAMIRNVV